MPSLSYQHRPRFIPNALMSAGAAAANDPTEAVEDVAVIVDGRAGVAALVEDAKHPDLVSASDVVVQLHNALTLPAIHPAQTVGRLLEVMETPLPWRSMAAKCAAASRGTPIAGTDVCQCCQKVGSSVAWLGRLVSTNT